MSSSFSNALLLFVSVCCFQSALSATSCSRGYYLDSANCYPCTPGTYCTDGLRSLPCNPGEYQDSFASSSCSRCTNGYYTITTGSTSCKICPVGNMCPNVDHDPIPCSAGTFQDDYGSSTCSQCPSGKKAI
jgi:hypothetical protein